MDYPKPIVKHEEISKENMSKMKLAYDAHKAGGGPDDKTGCSIFLLVYLMFMQNSVAGFACFCSGRVFWTGRNVVYVLVKKSST